MGLLARFRASPARYSSMSESCSESGDNSEQGLLEQKTTSRRRRASSAGGPCSMWSQPWTWIIQLMVLSVYTVLLLTLVKRFSQKSVVRTYADSLPLSPALEAVEWTRANFRYDAQVQQRANLADWPSPELDRQWGELLNAENIMIEEEYMRALGRENYGVRIPDGSGYIGTLNVYHEIHCLKRIHQYMYPDYYYPDYTAEQHELNRAHNEHCVGFLLQSIMCHGDAGIMTFEWTDDSLIPVGNSTTHQCIDWTKLDQWTKARSVDMMKPNWLIHPTKGPAYPNGKGDQLGSKVALAPGSHHKK